MSRVEVFIKSVSPDTESSPPSKPESPEPLSPPKPPVDREGVELLLKRLGKTKYLQLPTYEYHKRGKNWIAAITGTDPKYKFKREFIHIKTIDNTKVIEEDRILNVKFVQFFSMYYTGGGRESWDDEKRHYNGYWEIIAIDVSGAWAVKTKERNILEYFSA